MEENNVKKEIGERIKLIRTSLGMPKEVFEKADVPTCIFLMQKIRSSVLMISLKTSIIFISFFRLSKMLTG